MRHVVLDPRRAFALLVVLTTAAAAGCASKAKRDPDQSYVRYQLGVEYFQGRRIEAAVEELEKALAADPENADAHNMLGIIALKQGHDYVEQGEVTSCLRGRDGDLVRQDAVAKFRQAEKHLRAAVGFRNEFPDAWNNLAVAALALSDWPTAIQAAKQALKDSTYAAPEVARANLGWAYLQQRDLQNAWKELHEAVSRAPRFCVGRYRLGKVFFERGDMDQAAETLALMLDDPRCPIQDAYLLGGMVYEKRGDRDRARALFAKCSALAPRSCTSLQCQRLSNVIR
ncbi:MAG TPA: tetratricopeptide repeat protein [Polyangia bacterium]